MIGNKPLRTCRQSVNVPVSRGQHDCTSNPGAHSSQHTSQTWRGLQRRSICCSGPVPCCTFVDAGSSPNLQGGFLPARVKNHRALRPPVTRRDTLFAAGLTNKLKIRRRRRRRRRHHRRRRRRRHHRRHHQSKLVVASGLAGRRDSEEWTRTEERARWRHVHHQVSGSVIFGANGVARRILLLRDISRMSKNSTCVRTQSLGAHQAPRAQAG
jgi:hypothetical protein